MTTTTTPEPIDAPTLVARIRSGSVPRAAVEAIGQACREFLAAAPSRASMRRDDELDELAARFAADVGGIGQALSLVTHARSEWRELRRSNAGLSFTVSLPVYVAQAVQRHRAGGLL